MTATQRMSVSDGPRDAASCAPGWRGFVAGERARRGAWSRAGAARRATWLRAAARRGLHWLHEPTDVRSIAAFRILFGAVMSCALLRFMLRGWVDTQYVAPAFHFPYRGFDFLRPWPGGFMHVHFAAMILAALGLMLGYWYRASAFVFASALTYVELLDKATYLNHYYLVCLLAWMLVFIPAAGAYSCDALRRTELRVGTLPRWVLLALRVQVAVVYGFAGLAKINADWLLRAQPLRLWFAARSDLPGLGWLLAEPATAFAASWAGAVFDLSIVCLVSWRRTRRVALVVAVMFHALTRCLLPIGMFPWIMLAC